MLRESEYDYVLGSNMAILILMTFFSFLCFVFIRLLLETNGNVISMNMKFGLSSLERSADSITDRSILDVRGV